MKKRYSTLLILSSIWVLLSYNGALKSNNSEPLFIVKTGKVISHSALDYFLLAVTWKQQISQVHQRVSQALTPLLNPAEKTNLFDDITFELSIQNSILQSNVPADIKKMSQSRIEILNYHKKIVEIKTILNTIRINQEEEKYKDSVAQGEELIRHFQEEILRKAAPKSQ